MLFAGVKFFDEIFSVLDGDLVGISVQAIHHRYHILFFALYPPAVEMKACDISYQTIMSVYLIKKIIYLLFLRSESFSAEIR